jgi:hypothetical protein
MFIVAIMIPKKEYQWGRTHKKELWLILRNRLFFKKL